MRLALYVPHLDRQPAGLGRYITEICARLTRSVEHTHLFTESVGDVPPAWGDRVSVHAIPTPRSRLARRARFVARHAWLATWLPLTVRRLGCDVLFAPLSEGMPFPSIPQVMVVHDLTPLVVPSAYYHRLQSTYLRRVLPGMLRRSSAVIAVSQNTKSDLQRLLGLAPGHVRVVGEGYDWSIFRPRSDAERSQTRARLGLDRPFLFYSGTYAAHKNPRLLVEVLAALVEGGSDRVLALSGRFDAGDYPELERLIRERHLEDRILPLGYVSADDLSVLMQTADAFLFPSLYEGFGLAPLEAMASGALVLCSDRASLPEVVGDGGVLLDPERPRRWVEALRRLDEDPVAARAQRQRALAQAATFDWGDAAGRIREVLDDAANAGTMTQRSGARAP